MDSVTLFDLFTCERQAMRLTRPACAKLWISAKRNRPQPWEGRHSCLACPVGASHAGQTVEPNAAAAEAYRTLCPRCFRLASRMIQGEFCVSCYNRDREVQIGRDRKGARPKLADRLHPIATRVRRDGRAAVVRMERVIGLPEVMLRLAKTERGSLAIGRPGVADWPAARMRGGALSLARPRVVWWPGQPAQLELPLAAAA